MVVPSTNISPNITYHISLANRSPVRYSLDCSLTINETNYINRAPSKFFPKIIEKFKCGFLVCETGQIIAVRFPPATINFSLFQRIQTGFEANQASSSGVSGAVTPGADLRIVNLPFS
jgi:hypothetical protein